MKSVERRGGLPFARFRRSWRYVSASSRSLKASDFGFPSSADFKVLNGDGSSLVGYSHYNLTRNGGNSYLLYEEDHFLDGQHDIEHDQIEARGPGRPAVVITFEHDYFDAYGSPERVAKANFRTGEASCTVYENGRSRVNSSRIDFPLDTYSGSTVLIPLDYYLRRGSTGPISMHNFNCVPGPEILSIKTDPRYPAFWDHYPGQLLEMRLETRLRLAQHVDSSIRALDRRMVRSVRRLGIRRLQVLPLL